MSDQNNPNNGRPPKRMCMESEPEVIDEEEMSEGRPLFNVRGSHNLIMVQYRTSRSSQGRDDATVPHTHHMPPRVFGLAPERHIPRAEGQAIIGHVPPEGEVIQEAPMPEAHGEGAVEEANPPNIDHRGDSG